MKSHRKKLIEVALPLEAINIACAEDTNRKTGHIRNIHKWFAPMPLPAWRAVLFASLIDDPGNLLSPIEAARERQRLFRIIENLMPMAVPENAVKAAQREINSAWSGMPPTIVDPFCGGGSTILEAQRLGLVTFASDLNPVPVVITTALCVIPPLVRDRPPVSSSTQQGIFSQKHPLSGFFSDIHHYATRIQKLAWERLRSLYPLTHDGLTVTAWRWSWAVRSPEPRFSNSYTPLVADWSISKSKGDACWINPIVDHNAKEVTYALGNSGDIPAKTIHKTGGRCLFSNTPIPLPHIRAEGKAGRLIPHMLCCVAGRAGERKFYAPDVVQFTAANSAPAVKTEDSPLPPQALGFTVQGYGVNSFAQLFTRRQYVALNTFSQLIAESRDTVVTDARLAGWSDDDRSLFEGGEGARAYGDAVTTVLALCLDKMAQSNSILCRWFIDPRNGSPKANPAFDRHVISMLWDFAETNPFGGATGDWLKQVDTALQGFQLAVPHGLRSTVRQMDARELKRAGLRDVIVATDPPYFDNIAYADLSDFFYMWLRRSMSAVVPSIFTTVLTPKQEELIATRFRHGGDAESARRYFQDGFMRIFSDAAKIQHPAVPLSIVYALKQAENSDTAAPGTGWDAMLQGLVDAGLEITATWPMRTTRLTRMRGLNSNALASAIIIVCRPRASAAPTATRRDFLISLKRDLPEALKNLRAGNIAPVDLAQASIGPGMAIFSQHSSVLEADGSAMTIRSALTLINQTLDEVLTEEEGEFDADTRWALAWFEQFGMDEGLFGVAETLSKAKNSAVNGLVEAGIIAARSGKVRLLKRDELPDDWNPATDNKVRHWEVAQHLIRALETGGETASADLLRRVGGMGEVARDLAYRLYNICERKKWASEALAYNGLVIAWPEISKLAHAAPVAVRETEPTLFQRGEHE